MRIYLREDLIKGESSKAKPEGAQKNKTGETRGGNYVARVQIGYEKDGSPRYKYFKTLDERDKYLAGRGKADSKRSAKKLKNKTEKEQEEHSDKEKATRGKSEHGDKLYVKKDEKESSKDPVKKSNDKEVVKGFPHFIWSLGL